MTNTPSEEADKHCSLLFCDRPAYGAGVCEEHYVKPDPTPSDLPSGDMELRKLIKAYGDGLTVKGAMYMTDSEFLTALQALQDKKVADELNELVAKNTDTMLGTTDVDGVFEDLCERIAQLTNNSKGGK